MAIGGFTFTLYETLPNCTDNVNMFAQATYNAAGKKCQAEVAQAEHYFMVRPPGTACPMSCPVGLFVDRLAWLVCMAIANQ
jgi:hypothetical protein